MAEYNKINPSPPRESDVRSIVKAVDDMRRALKEIYRELDRLEKEKQDK